MARGREPSVTKRKKATTPKPEPSKALSEARVTLKEFLAENEPSTIKEVTDGDNVSLRICEPWGDNSFSLGIPDDIKPFAAALNKVRFPKRLSALWHKDTHDLEVIWTAHNLPKSQIEISTRSFSFCFEEKSYICEFGESSERLLVIANQMIPITMSQTDWRNLQSFSQYARFPKERHSNLGLSTPRSFWIRGVDYNEEDLLRLIEHLNFYLTYYDSRSPMVLVHEPLEPNNKAAQRTRYIHGAFPDNITSGSLDIHMLSFWNSAYDENPMMSFLLYFRVIEYAAIHHIDSLTRAQLRKLLMAPNIKANIAGTIEGIVGSLYIQKLDDTQRFKAVLRQCVDPKLLWKDVQPNMAFFSRDTDFDGGFKVKKLVSQSDDESTFCTRGVEIFSDSARKIRNALAHGKDMETAGVITPTTRNVKLFLPWVHLMATAAGEVVLYKDAA